MYLFFLLTRYGALRPSEINTLNCHEALDRQTGKLCLSNRSLFLPTAALRPLRRILGLPESRDEDFLRLDPGFLRRTFYAMAKLANLPPECCAPRALRYARAIEMCDMHMPLRLVAQTLGMSNILQLEKLLRKRRIAKKPEAEKINCLSGLITGMETGHWSGKLVFQIPDLGTFYCLCPLEEILKHEPAIGQAARFHLPPRAIRHNDKNEGLNSLDCRILSVRQDALESCLELRAGANLYLQALMDNHIADSLELNPGHVFKASIPPHMISLEGCS